MKTKLLIASLCLCYGVNAQFSMGVKLDLNYGGIGSENLVKNLDYRRSLDPSITEWSVKNSWGFGFGAGGFLAYNLTNNFSIIAEPTIDYLKCGIDFRRVDNNVNGNGDGNVVTQTTSSDIDVTYFNLPLLARYSFTPNKFFLEAGVGINFLGTPNIRSSGMTQVDHFSNGFMTGTTINPTFVLETKLNVFNSPRVNFIFGLGKTFDVNGRALSIDIRYNLPLTESQMFTTDANYNGALFGRNDLLGNGGRLDAEDHAPFMLNDFKMSVLTLSVSYVLFQKQ